MSKIWCCDLDGTITASPVLFKKLLHSLIQQGNTVMILTGMSGKHVTSQIVEEKRMILNDLGFHQGKEYHKLIVVSGPQKKVPEHKLSVMQHYKAFALIDNSKQNIKAITRAGFVGLHYRKPKAR
jgi:hypothetical protein